MKNFIVYYLTTIMLYGGWALAAPCESDVFSGTWTWGNLVDTATIVTNGNNITGHFDTIQRPPFSGTILEGGYQVDMIFPDDASYRGTIEDDGCKIQWSYPNSPNTVNPNNYWLKIAENCDSDGDGILNESDLCPETGEGETADIYGCSAFQFSGIDCATATSVWLSHDDYMTHVSHHLIELMKNGEISGQEKGQLTSEAAQLQCW